MVQSRAGECREPRRCSEPALRSPAVPSAGSPPVFNTTTDDEGRASLSTGGTPSKNSVSHAWR